jgi:hypothetical protein
MKTSSGSAAAASAFAALYLKDRAFVETRLGHVTEAALHSLDSSLRQELNNLIDNDGSSLLSTEEDCHVILARACIRRIAYRCLDKYARLQSSQKYGGNTLPATWYESLNKLKEISTMEDKSSLDLGKLWRLILEHPMTSYVPVQCQSCGHIVPDQYPTTKSDAEVGLREIDPTGEELELRSGWFRGPRKAVVFQLTCQRCQSVTNWYRSGHPKILLNPNRWGRLCGDQEDLRLTLADYLNIPVRLIIPLDWDHVWSEFNESSNGTSPWQVQDDSARNFCCRLDEGIGSWTRVWAIHPNSGWCEDVTRDYLICQQEGGRADNHIDNVSMEKYAKIVEDAQKDMKGSLTQAKTVNGYILYRANLTDDNISVELQRAASDYGRQREWWEFNIVDEDTFTKTK